MPPAPQAFQSTPNPNEAFYAPFRPSAQALDARSAASQQEDEPGILHDGDYVRAERGWGRDEVAGQSARC